MSFSKKGMLLSCLLCACVTGFSQIFGGNPASTHWQQINTPFARVIFPAGLDSTANHIVNVIGFIKGPTEKSIGNKIKKINIVLQNHTTLSNGYVNLGPFKSEFFLTPTQNSFELGSLPWPDQLTIHEYRHVEQYNNFDVGLSRTFHQLFGEEGQAIINNAAIPNWFYEGDAVYNETNVSRQGRGSLPFFYNGYRSLWKAGNDYSWMKLRNGSYKDFVPNHYELGYMLVAYGREKYGAEFWKKVTRDAAAFKGIFYPFQKAVEKYSGVDYATFRNNALSFFRSRFDLKPAIQAGSATVVNEEYPAFTQNGIVYVKSGYKQIPEFIVRSDGKEKKLRVRDVSLDNYFSLSRSRIVYAAYHPDIRWGYRDFSDLVVTDINTGKERSLTSGAKYFSPSFNEQATKIVVVDESVKGRSTLLILDDSTGKILHTVPNPQALFYTYPKFFPGDKILAAVRDTTGKMAMATIEISDGHAEFLTPFTYNVMGFPCVKDDTVYFTASLDKSDELLAITLLNKKIWRILYTSENGIGKYQPSVSDTAIAWSTFTALGYKIINAPKRNLVYQPLDPWQLEKARSSFGITVLCNEDSALLGRVPANKFQVSKYPKSFNLINFHSVEPTADDPQYSITLLSENILNTLLSQVSFTYDRAEKFERIGAQAVYGGFFPFLSAGINYTLDSRTVTPSQKLAYFNELEPYAGFNIPLNFSRGRNFAHLNFGADYVYNESDYKGWYKDSIGKISYSYLSNFLSFSNQIQKARQQIFPHFAQSFTLSYKSAVSHYKGRQLMFRGNVYFPGLGNTNSTVLNAAFLSKDSMRQTNFSSGFPFSRGYHAANFQRMYKAGINYHIPLLYPDRGFANIFYLLRIRASLFYDYTCVRDFLNDGKAFRRQFKSAGTEINFDTKWWNQANVAIGIRYSYLFDKDLFGNHGSNRWEKILPVNIFNQ